MIRSLDSELSDLLGPIVANAVLLVSTAYENSRGRPWVVGYSGGKDSSALIKILFAMLRRARRYTSPVHLCYCDTGVEIPPIRDHAVSTITRIEVEARRDGIPITSHIARPVLNDRFFVKVIGRGYPPPTNKFRWCTDRLRINPIASLMKSVSGDNHVLVLGVRRGESPERDRILTSHASENPICFKHEGSGTKDMIAPLINFSLADVWDVLASQLGPVAIDSNSLGRLYRLATGECPVIRESTTEPCAGARFGCWSCTVVRKDKAVSSLVAHGFDRLKPLLLYRNMLASMRNDPRNREKFRRNRQPGPGPLTLFARRRLFTRLMKCQRESGYTLISEEEVDAIKALWSKDEC